LQSIGKGGEMEILEHKNMISEIKNIKAKFTIILHIFKDKAGKLKDK
jgi:hypothetical protein